MENLSNMQHNISYEFSAPNLHVIPSLPPYIRRYTTDCKHFPTSWQLKVQFLEVKEDATASLSVTLKRIDNQDTDPEVWVCVKICNSEKLLLFRTQAFNRYRMFPNGILQETVEISPFPEKKEEINENIIVQIEIEIDCCHLDSSSTDITSSDTSFSEEN